MINVQWLQFSFFDWLACLVFKLHGLDILNLLFANQKKQPHCQQHCTLIEKSGC